MDLTFELVPLHAVDAHRVPGDRSASQKATCDAWADDRFGPTPPVGRAADVSQRLQDYYRERGYLRASITPVADVDHVSANVRC